MKSLHTRKGGFTLIELMIVVAIIGILAAIAIPNFLRFQLRARSSEGKTNLAAIRTAEEGYNAEFGTYLDAAPNPGVQPTSAKVVWAPGGVAIPGFDPLGWSPEGEVYFQYEVGGTAPAPGVPMAEFHAVAHADLDNNTTTQDWGYVKPIPGAAAFAGTAPSVPGNCIAAGVYNATSQAQDLLETVGPCDQFSGQSEF